MAKLASSQLSVFSFRTQGTSNNGNPHLKDQSTDSIFWWYLGKVLKPVKVIALVKNLLRQKKSYMDQELKLLYNLFSHFENYYNDIYVYIYHLYIT